MTPQMLADLTALGPELWLTGAIVVTLLADLVVGKRWPAAVGVLALAGVAGALWSLAGAEPAAEGARALGVMRLDGFGAAFRTLIIAGTGIVVLHAMVFREIEDATRNEFHPMLLSAALGACLLVATDHLLMLVLAMEMLSMPSYLLAGWARKERRSSEAALKYLVFGAMASGLILFGFSLLYGMSGSLWMSDVAVTVAEQWSAGGLAGRSAVVGAVVLVFAGFGFKMAAFPFHFWAPDVYEGSPTPVTTLLAVVSKAAAFGVVVRFVDAVFLGDGASADWVARFGWLMAVLAAVTMTYGNVTAVLQRNVKRLLAYSSIAHAGFLLMGVAVMASDPSGGAVALGTDTLIFYLVTYYLATLGAFGCIMALTNRFGVEDLDDYQGLGWSSPWVCGALVVFLVSLTGLPPTAGFVGKWKLFTAAFEADLSWLAVVAALNAAVALFYYFKLARALFLRGDWSHVEGRRSRGLIPWLAQASLAGLAVAVVWYGLAFDGLVTWISSARL